MALYVPYSKPVVNRVRFNAPVTQSCFLQVTEKGRQLVRSRNKGTIGQHKNGAGDIDRAIPTARNTQWPGSDESMAQFGFEKLSVVGRTRGGRVGPSGQR